MSEEESGAKYDRPRWTSRRNHKEADEVLATAPPSGESKSRLNVIHIQLELQHEVLSGLNTQIIPVCDIANIEEDVDSVFEDLILSSIFNLHSRIWAVTLSASFNSSSELPVPTTAVAERTRLPKLVLPKFKGDVTQWTSFWDSYKNTVHENIDISTTDKFNYLKSLLEGPAARCVHGLLITECNYDSAVELLQERFGKLQQIVVAHVDELNKLPVASDRPSSLRFILTFISGD